IALWSAGVGIIALAIAYQLWFLIFVGGWLLFRLFQLVRAMVLSFRHSPLCVGVLAGLGRPIPLLQISLAQVRLADGREVTASIRSVLASGLIDEPKVLVLHDEK